MDKVREEFEKWLRSTTDFDTFRTNYAMTKPEDQQYMCHRTNLAWFAWKASREYLVVQLPKKRDENQCLFDFQRAYWQGYNQSIDDIIKNFDEVGVVKYE